MSISKKVVWGAILTGWAWASLEAQAGPPLATVAATEAVRRATVTAPAKVYTNADVREAVPATRGAWVSQIEPIGPLTRAERADALLGDRIQALALEVRRVLDHYDHYRAVCETETVSQTTGALAGGGSSLNINSDGVLSLGWFSVGGTFMSETRTRNETTPVCRDLFEQAWTVFTDVQMKRATINDQARAARIDPGILRDLFATYHLPKTFQQ